MKQKIEVYANVRQIVMVDPIEVIEKLISIELNNRDWIFMEDDKYFRGYEVGLGQHSCDEKIEITKKKYEYIDSLTKIEEYLKNQKE